MFQLLQRRWRCYCPHRRLSRTELDQIKHYVSSSQATWISLVLQESPGEWEQLSSWTRGQWVMGLQWIQLDNKGNRTGCNHLPAALFNHWGKYLGASSPLWRKKLHIAPWKIISGLAHVFVWEENWKFGASFIRKFLGLRLHTDVEMKCSGI